MIRVFESEHIERDARNLPREIQTKLACLLEFFKEDPFDARLHTKSLVEPLRGLFTFRITRDWRVLFKFLSPREVLLLRIRHRKDMYR